MRVRIGAFCNDGTYSTATGQGACSHHGGVREWLYADQQPKTPPKFSQSSKHQTYENFFSMPGKKKEEVVQTKMEKQLKKLVNQLKGENQKLIQDLKQYKEIDIKQVSSWMQKIKQKQQQMQLMENEKTIIQKENVLLKQALNKAAQQKARYENAITHLRKKSANLQADLVIMKQANYISTQRMIVEKQKQLRSKIEEELRSNFQEELKKEIQQQLIWRLQKQYIQQTQQLIAKHKLQIQEMQTRLNQLLSYKQTYLLQITKLKDKLKEAESNLQKLNQKNQIKQLELNDYKYKYEEEIELVKEEHKENINNTLEKLKKDHEEEVARLREEKEKLETKLLQEKESRTKQVARAKSILIAKHEKEIRQLQQSHQLKQKLFNFELSSMSKNISTQQIKEEKPIRRRQQLAQHEMNMETYIQNCQMNKVDIDRDRDKDCSQGIRGSEDHITWNEKKREVQSDDNVSYEQSRQEFPIYETKSICVNVTKVILLLTFFVVLKLLFISGATVNYHVTIK